MLETLTRGFRSARDALRGATELSEENTAEALRAVRLSLLEADVDLGVVREFLERVKERCLGAQVQTRAAGLRLGPGEHFTRACYEELVALMGAGEPIAPSKKTRALMLLGLQGSGKTSTAAKLALHFQRQGERPLLVASDVRRPAAREQLQTLGEKIGVQVFTEPGDDAVGICERALAHARSAGLHTVILDTAGRLQIDDELMAELVEIDRRVRPEHRVLVCDAMMGREAVRVAQGFAARVPLDGLILTKLDGDARGGAALAIRHATGVPIRWVAVGEAVDRLEPFRADGLASRILGMGDVVGLARDFEQAIDEQEAKKAERDAQRMLRGQFTLDDFLSQLRMLGKMGPLRDLLDKLPFAGDLIPEGVQVDPRELGRIEAMILSMTPDERRRPQAIDASRTRRIARGSGTGEADVSGLLERFRAMQGMMAQIGGSLGGGMLGKIPGLGKLLGGGGLPDMAGLDAQALLAGGGSPNRRAARAMKAEAKRQKRKQMRKHKRKGKKK
jgi:signal recognition particle subunit SRP54